MTKPNLLFASIIVAFFLLSCDSDDNPSDPIDEIGNRGFSSTQVAEVLVKNCAVEGCHAGNEARNGLSLENYESLIKGSSKRPLPTGGTYGGDVIIPFNSEKSLLYQLISGGANPTMPFNRSALPDEEIQLIKDWIDNGARDENNNTPFQNSSHKIFVCNQGSDAISVIDGDLNVVSRIIDVDFNQTLDSPHMVKYKNGFLYATLISAGKFLKINTSDFSIVGEVNNLGFPGMIMLSEINNKAYVSRSSTAPESFSSIYVIDTDNMTLIKEIILPVAGIPHGIVLSTDNSKLYIANLTQNRINIVDTQIDEFEEDFVLSQDIDHEPMQTNVSPDGNFLYVSAKRTGKFLVIDLNTKSIVKEIDAGGGPMHIAVSNDGNKIYVPSMMSGFINIIDFTGSDWIKSGEITHPAFIMLHGAELSPDGKYLYVSSRNTNGNFEPAYKVQGEGNIATLGIINLENNQVEKILEIEEFGSGVTVSN